MKRILLVAFIVLATVWIGVILYSPHEAASIGIIGKADGPTTIFISSKLLKIDDLLLPVLLLLGTLIAVAVTLKNRTRR